MNEYVAIFNKTFLKMSDKDVQKFQEIYNKLSNINYLTAYKEEDKSDYYFICNNLECFQSYFYLGGKELTHYQNQRTFVLSSQYTQKLSLNKTTSIIILIVRLLYNQKMLDLSLDSQIRITSLEIQEKYEQVMNSSNERLNTKELSEALRILKRHNIVDFKGNDYQQDDFNIIIYPTIQFAVAINDINSIIEKLNTYNGKEDEYEETEEN